MKQIKHMIQAIVLIVFLSNFSLLYAAIPEQERQALIDLYHSTGGDNWTHNSGWLGEVGTECDWFGITCDNDKTHVLKIGLHNNKLTGNISKSIGDFTNLTYLNLRDNDIASIPPEIGNLVNLTSLYLYSNDLTSIPPEIGNLVNLTSLYLYSNDLTTVPSEVWSLTNLTYLSLGNNDLTSIP
ncbi:MAG: leucine-rich repeat-containing protein, partial [Candidatus Magnetoglobus multicellularis str. Araruama]